MRIYDIGSAEFQAALDEHYATHPEAVELEYSYYLESLDDYKWDAGWRPPGFGPEDAWAEADSYVPAMEYNVICFHGRNCGLTPCQECQWDDYWRAVHAGIATRDDRPSEYLPYVETPERPLQESMSVCRPLKDCRRGQRRKQARRHHRRRTALYGTLAKRFKTRPPLDRKPWRCHSGPFTAPVERHRGRHVRDRVERLKLAAELRETRLQLS